ncbi:hypothetical protein F2Q69_00038275 [Brassica cretica]|uniref:Uncharacterized protein n=1 Tax=Brassica cretica TaxID=69181 RepID=A0A8S9SLY9_BRACR|nr:hypothetical protein F2Q69_00038275 [Brassica cretica]
MKASSIFGWKFPTKFRRNSRRRRNSVGKYSLSEDGGSRPLRRSAPRVPFVPPPFPPPFVPPADPAAPYEPGTMQVELLVLQPGREHLCVLHPYPQGYTTWCINQMMCSMLRKGYPTYSVMPDDERHLRRFQRKKVVWLVWLGVPLLVPSSSQASFAPPDPMIIEHLQNKDDRIVAPEMQNATILAELAGQKRQTRR